MTDQPETMLEYHFRKLGRKVSAVAGLICAVVYITAAGIVAASDPLLSLLFTIGTYGMLAVSYSIMNDGRLRSIFNRLCSTNLTDLERPDSSGEKEVFADD